MSERAGSFYVDLKSDDEKDSVVTRPVSKIITSVITGLLSLLILAVAVFPAALSPRVSEHAVGTRVDAGTLGFACSQLMGANMDSQASWYNALKSYPVSDKQGRRLTMQEALQNGLFFVNYHGEGKGELFVRDKESDLYKEHSKTDVKTLEGKRNLNNCTLNGLGIISANGLLGIANGISGITQYIVQHSFDADLICTDVKNPTDDCFNLLKIIGGNGTPSATQVANGNSNGGIIGVLTSSIYMTLVSLVFIFVAITFIWKAAIHRQFREAFAGLGWALISYFVGFMLLLHPALLAQAPLAASSTVATCVIGAFSGQNCMNDTDTNSDLAEGEESSAAICKSSVADASPSEHMEMVAGGLTCKIWKSFILNMYSQGSFGTSFDNLDTMSTDRPTNKILTDAGLNPEDYCVHLYTDGSIDGQKNGTLKTVEKGTSNRVCNLAAYQMYLETKVQSGDDTLPENGKADVRWYKVVDAAAANNGFWDNWGGSFASTNSKNGIALMAIIVTVLGSLILVITSLYANVYYISSAVLTSFAPIFLLIGVVPGRGRRIMLGWLEKVVSNVMKYIASAAFLVVTIAIYGAILESMGSIGMTLLFTILMTMALFMYRREIIDLIGRANLGGEQLSSRMTDRLGNTMHNGLRGTRDVAAAMAGGALGAKLAGGTLRSGGADAVSRELKRSRGFVGNIARQVDRENIANRGKLKNKESEARNQATEAKRTASNYETAGKRAQTEFDNLDKEQTGLQKESSEIESRRRRMTHSDVVAQEDMLTEAKLAEQKIRRMPDATPEQIESAVARKEQMLTTSGLVVLHSRLSNLTSSCPRPLILTRGWRFRVVSTLLTLIVDRPGRSSTTWTVAPLTRSARRSLRGLRRFRRRPGIRLRMSRDCRRLITGWRRLLLLWLRPSLSVSGLMSRLLRSRRPPLTLTCVPVCMARPTTRTLCPQDVSSQPERSQRLTSRSPRPVRTRGLCPLRQPRRTLRLRRRRTVTRAASCHQTRRSTAMRRQSWMVPLTMTSMATRTTSRLKRERGRLRGCTGRTSVAMLKEEGR